MSSAGFVAVSKIDSFRGLVFLQIPFSNRRSFLEALRASAMLTFMVFILVFLFPVSAGKMISIRLIQILFKSIDMITLISIGNKDKFSPGVSAL